MRTIPLIEIATIASGATPSTSVPAYWDGNIPWITPADFANHDGIYFRGQSRRITKEGFDHCSAPLLPPGSILFSSRAPIGHCALLDYPACTNQGFKSIIPSERLDSLYGFFAIKFLTPSIIAQGRGATFLEVNKEIMEDLEVPYCDLPEQRRIGQLLERADRLCRMRRYALEMCDQLRLTNFHEQLKRCAGQQMSLGGICSKITDGVHITPTYVKNGVPFLRVTDIQDDDIDWSQVKRIPNDEYDHITRHTKPDLHDILYSKNGTIGIAKEITWEEPFAHFVSLALLKPIKELVNSTFLTAWLNTPAALRQATAHSKTGTVTNLHLNEIEKIIVPLPSMSEQNNLVSVIRSANRVRATHAEALRLADHLFQTLLHQAFAGR